MAQASRPLAVVTGASTGIGLELARIAGTRGYDLVIAADEPAIHDAAATLRSEGCGVYPVEVNFATADGVEKLYDEAMKMGKPIDLLFANAGRGFGGAFLGQDFDGIRKVIDTNIVGTVYLLQKVGRDMRARGAGRILITGSIAGFIPGSYHAVYNATKAFVDSFASALRNELKDTGVSVTCLMPGATETEFFERADMMDTKVGTAKKDDPADVAKTGWNAMMRGDESVIYGLKNKVQVAASHVLPRDVLAEIHRKDAQPGTAKR